MREYKFRGLDREIGIWRYGCLLSIKCGDGFSPAIEFYDKQGHYCKYWVKRETVGQFIGLADQNFNYIYEGDIVSYSLDNKYEHISYGIVLFDAKESTYIIRDNIVDSYLSKVFGIVVVGNIHENKDLK